MGFTVINRNHIHLIFDLLFITILIIYITTSHKLVFKAKLHQISKEAYQAHKQCQRENSLLNMESTLECLNKVLSIYPFSAKAHYEKASIYKFSGKPQMAIYECRKALEIRPKYIKAYLEIGSLNERKGDLNAAIKAYTKAISVNQRCDEAFSSRGSIYRKQGLINSAMNDCNHALKINPGNTKAYSEKMILSKNINKAIISWISLVKNLG